MDCQSFLFAQGCAFKAGGRLHDWNRLCTSRGLILSNHTSVFVCLLWKMDYFNENDLHAGLIAVTLDSALLSWLKTGPVWAPVCTMFIIHWCQVKREFQWLIKLPNSTEYPSHSTSLVAEWFMSYIFLFGPCHQYISEASNRFLL